MTSTLNTGHTYVVINADQSRTVLGYENVNYHGSLTAMHGEVQFFGPCGCRDDYCTGYELETASGVELHHVRAESFSLLRSMDVVE